MIPEDQKKYNYTTMGYGDTYTVCIKINVTDQVLVKLADV